jgi:hypothetical protein
LKIPNIEFTLEIKMNKSALLAAAAALAAPAAFAATVAFDQSAGPQGAHVQTGSPDCTVATVNNVPVVTCSTYELAGVGNTNAVGNLSATYSGTVLCTNPGGNVAPGQTQFPTIPTSTGTIQSKNGRLTVPALSSTTNVNLINNDLIANTRCPNGKWTKSVQEGSIALQGFTYTLTFAGFTDPYILITP